MVMSEMKPMEKKKKKPRDLTLGAFHPSEKIVELGDGTKVVLEDYTTPKPKEQVDKEHAGEPSEEALKT